MLPSHGKLIFNGALRHFQDGGYLLDGPVLEIKQGNGGLFLLRKAVEGLIQLLVAEGAVGSIPRSQIESLLYGSLLRTGLPAVVYVTIVRYAEEPGAEFGQSQEGAGGHIGPHQGVLRDVIGQATVSGTQGKQEPSQGLLLLPHLGDEPLLGHGQLLFGLVQGVLFGLYLLGQHLLTYKVGDEQADAYGQEDRSGRKPELVDEHIAPKIGNDNAKDAQGEEADAHEAGNAGAIEFIQKFLLDGLGSLLLDGFKLGHVHGNTGLDGLEHDFGLSVGLVLTGAGNEPDDHDGQYDANKEGYAKIYQNVI